MTPVYQTQFAGEGVGGNCVQAAVASILDLSLDDVPHFLEGGDPTEWMWRFEDFIAHQGFDVLWSGVTAPGGMARDYGGLYLAIGPSHRGVNHMVVMCDGEMVHDPHPMATGLKSVWQTIALLPLDPATAIRQGVA